MYRSKETFSRVFRRRVRRSTITVPAIGRCPRIVGEGAGVYVTEMNSCGGNAFAKVPSLLIMRTAAFSSQLTCSAVSAPSAMIFWRKLLRHFNNMFLQSNGWRY